MLTLRKTSSALEKIETPHPNRGALPRAKKHVLFAGLPFALLGVLLFPWQSTGALSIDELPTPVPIVGKAVSEAQSLPPPVQAKSIEKEEAPSIRRESFVAIITQYSRQDSCHNIRDGKCIMASGKPVYVGAVACPTFLSLGTVILLDGNRYTCEDRYAPRLDHERLHPTIDVFVESNPHGRSTTEITVLG